jgi:hypothetical protein
MNLSMKKIFGIALLALALGFGFTSCSDDDEPAVPSTDPAEASAGVYTGTWTRVQGTETVVEPGTLTFAAADSKNVTNVTATCAAIDVDYTSAANITYAIGNAGTGYIFTNGTTDNGFGTYFSGRISPEGKATIAYSKTVKVGRKNYTYNYTFEGTK